MLEGPLRPRRSRSARLLTLGATLAVVAGLALGQGPASSSPPTFASLPADLELRRAATMQLLCDPDNPLALAPDEVEELRLKAILVVEGLETSLLRQTRLREDLQGRWRRPEGPASAGASPEADFLRHAEAASQRLAIAARGRPSGQASPLDLVADEWFEDLLPVEQRLSLEELGRLLDEVSRDCSPEEAELLLPEVQALRREVRRLQLAWQGLENFLDRPDRVVMIAARMKRLQGSELPDLRELGGRWADEGD